jgi:hypothetical protein
MLGIDFSTHAANPTAQGTAQAAANAQEKTSSFGFDDLLDLVNPLQHIPVISTLYRHLTGDKINMPAKLAGDALYGGVTGFFSSVGDSVFQELTGKSIGDTVYALVIGDDDDKTTGIAAADKPVTVTPASSTPIAMPDFSFLDLPDETPAAQAAQTLQRANAAYRGRTMEAY